MSEITFEEFRDSFAWWKTREVVVGPDETVKNTLPYDLFPGSLPGGNAHLITQAEWEKYQWNPPGFIPALTDSQEDVSSKPSWQEILDAVEPGYLMRRKPELVSQFNAECRHRITSGYGESNVDDEGFARLEAMETGAESVLVQRIANGNTERNRLRTRYQELKAWVEGATKKATLESVNPYDDEYWAVGWAAPEEENE